MELEQLYLQFYARLQQYAHKWAEDTDDIHDIVMDAMLSCSRRMVEGYNVHQVEAYLYKAVYNRCVEEHRRRVKYEAWNDWLDIAYYHECRLEASEKLNLTALVQLLHPAKRRILELDLQGYKTPAICRMLKQPAHTIYTTRSRALECLKELIRNKIPTS